jgi:ATP/maltotriose-dependent transcriptional regulator MalT
LIIGEGLRDRDLVALARNLLARALLRLGRVESGLALLDEVMLEVTGGELSPIATGIVYCNVIATCQQMQALDRAREWTAALASWCAEQPELVTFTGYCQLHRAEILQLEGAWPEAMAEVRAICEQTKRTGDPEVLGDACYQRAELLRLRGELEEAEATYRLASQSGRDPQPGLALLRLLQGRPNEAASGIDRALSTTTLPWQRARLLPAFIEIMLAAGEVSKARGAVDELEAMAASAGTEVVAAMAAHARGALTLAQGNPGSAIEPLRHAFVAWQKVGAPYIAARIRVLLGRAFQACGDHDGAQLELDAARRVFQQLAATPDLDALDTATNPERLPASHGLSVRELEVLRLLASGRTNKEIGSVLHVSERTIDRHVSNIFTKLNVPTRTAATAFAYEKGLV